jgi:hypothetical protein
MRKLSITPNSCKFNLLPNHLTLISGFSTPKKNSAILSNNTWNEGLIMLKPLQIVILCSLFPISFAYASYAPPAEIQCTLNPDDDGYVCTNIDHSYIYEGGWDDGITKGVEQSFTFKKARAVATGDNGTSITVTYVNGKNQEVYILSVDGVSFDSTSSNWVANGKVNGDNVFLCTTANDCPLTK